MRQIILHIIPEKTAPINRYNKNFFLLISFPVIANICIITHNPPVEKSAAITGRLKLLKLQNSEILVISVNESIAALQSSVFIGVILEISADMISTAPEQIKSTLNTENAVIIVHI